jgi:hypothetical protein
MPPVLLVGAVAFGLSVCPAYAATPSEWEFVFSAETSDATDPALLDATWTYSYDYTAQTFDITVQNQTVNPPAAFTLSELFFNMTDGLFTDIDLAAGQPDFSTATLTKGPSNKTKADGFGEFDFFVDLVEPPDNNAGIDPGTLGTVSFTITDGADVSAYTLFSELTDGIEWRWAAVKWTQGIAEDGRLLEETDDSTYATPTPEPCTFALLLCTGPALFAVTRRRRQNP